METAEPWVPDPEAQPDYGDRDPGISDDRPCRDFSPDPNGVLTFGGDPACVWCGWSEARHA